MCVGECSSMQRIYRRSDQDFEVFTTVFSPQGGPTPEMINDSITMRSITLSISVQIQDQEETSRS